MRAVIREARAGDVLVQGPWGRKAPGGDAPYEFTLTRPITVRSGRVEYGPDSMTLTLLDESGEPVVRRPLEYREPAPREDGS